jgi:hypothetical protein
MKSAATEKLWTDDQLLALHSGDGRKHEMWFGKIITMPPREEHTATLQRGCSRRWLRWPANPNSDVCLKTRPLTDFARPDTHFAAC